ncbi:hypothetical protein FS837_002715 [Tulasnella sp. UAMH 9824]|nr:hypothetical protein FS837_002715 [Tulasnella sp. UAMH 9824]
MFCNIDTHTPIHNFGLSESVAVLVCVDGSLVVADLQTPLQHDTIPLRRETRLHSRSIHQVVVLQNLILLVRGLNRGVAIDAYELYAGTTLSTYSEAQDLLSEGFLRSLTGTTPTLGLPGLPNLAKYWICTLAAALGVPSLYKYPLTQMTEQYGGIASRKERERLWLEDWRSAPRVGRWVPLLDPQI